MKLKTSIARLIRRSGYAVALTLAAGSFAPANQPTETFVEYLSRSGNITALVDRASAYNFPFDVTVPSTPENTKLWDTQAIVDAVVSEGGAVRGWCPWRKQGSSSTLNNYDLFIPYLKNSQYIAETQLDGNVMKISNAIRPALQGMQPGQPALPLLPTDGKYPGNIDEISYVGTRALPVSKLDCSDAWHFFRQEGSDGKFYNANGVEASLDPLYDTEGKPYCENGKPLYTARNTSQYYYKDEDGNLVPITATTGISASYYGDNYAGVRGIIVEAASPIHLENNRLIIDHSGFALAIGAYTHWGNVEGNLTYLQDVRVSDDVYAATTYRGDSEDNTLIVIRAQAIGQNTTLSDEAAGVNADNYNNSGKMYAVYSLSKKTNNAKNNKAFFYGSSTFQHVGGALAGGNSDSNLLFISRSNIAVGLQDVASVVGGDSISVGHAEDNFVIVDDTFDEVAAGIAPEQLDSTVASSVPDVSTIHEDIIGGRTIASQAETSANQNKVILIGKTTPSTQKENKGEIVTTTVQGNIFGGVAENSRSNDATAQGASANDNTVVISGVDVERNVVVPLLMGRQPELWGEKVLSTDVGRICGGYAGAPVAAGTAPGNANNNSVILLDTTAVNTVYGGTNAGNGQASHNELHLSHIDTIGADGKARDLVFYGGWIESYARGGSTNHNSVYLYDSGWGIDNTFLHGGWGNELKKNDDGTIVWKDPNFSVPGATSFDGTHFYSGLEQPVQVASVSNSRLVKADGSTNIFGNVTIFDGGHFYDASRNMVGTLEKMAILKPSAWDKNGNVTEYTDAMIAVERINKKSDGSIDFLSADSDVVIATYWPAEKTIKGAAGVVIAQDVTYKEETGEFIDSSQKAAIIIAEGAIVNSDDKVKPGNWGINLNEPEKGIVYDAASGDVSFKDTEGNLIAIFKSSSIKGTDIVLANTRSTDEHGNTIYQRANINSIFTRIDGFDEYQTFTQNNWLYLVGYQNKIKGFDHFEHLRFIFTDEISLDSPMLLLTGAQSEGSKSSSSALITTSPGADPATVKLTADIAMIADELKGGDIVPVIGDENHEKIEGLALIPRDSVVDDNQVYRQGVTRTIQLETEFFEVDNTDNDTTNDADETFRNYGVIKVLERKENATPESKSLIEGRIAMLTLNNMGGNLLAEQGIDSACRALEGGEPADAKHFVPVEQNGKGAVAYAPKAELSPGNRLFFAMSGAHTKVDSGSDVDVDGTNALVGVSRGFLEKRALTMGIFMETGWGKYHTHNNFGVGANVPYVRGTGETSYVGAGALLRYRLEHLSDALAGFSLDASLRAGRQELDYSTADLADDYGEFASYEHESDYLAGHVGINYTFEPTDKLAATLYARYLWTHVSNDDADVCGEQVTFEDMSSNRIRLGGRLSWQANDHWTPYVGAAFEWECSGTAHAVTHGMGITAPSMRGGSIIGEIGTVWQPWVTRALWVEAALQGSVGKNENYGAKLGVSIGF